MTTTAEFPTGVLTSEEVAALDAPSQEQFRKLVRRERVSRIPEPPSVPARVPIVSADDHFVEPPDVFSRFLPKALHERAPRVIENEAGAQFWQFEDQITPLRGSLSVVGRPRDEWTLEPLRYDEMRAGAYDPAARIRDMDLSGVAVTLCFPSAVFGFGGQRFFRMRDRELGLACMRAYNDWIIDDWVASDPRRFVAQQVPWYPDPEIAAAEIRKNAGRGYKAVSFSENPEALGFPSVHSTWWDPFFKACEETGTVINLHIGSSSAIHRGSTGAGIDVALTLFPVSAIISSVDWLYARIPLRFPDLKVVFSESCISWIPCILERLRRVTRMSETDRSAWMGVDMAPDEVYKSAFWFTSIEDYVGLEHRDEIGVDNIMVETDYPHNDTSWPDTQEILFGEIGHLPEDEKRRIAYKNAAEVYGLSVPEIEKISDQLTATATGPV